MPDPKRPYQHHSEAELVKERHRLKEAYDYHASRLKKMKHYDDDRKAVKDRCSEIRSELIVLEHEFAVRRKGRESGAAT